MSGSVVLDAATGATVSGPYDGTALSIGPDSRTGLLFGAEIRLVDVLTGEVTRTFHRYANRAGGSISPDGRTIFAATLSGLLELIDMATEARIGNPIRLTRDFLSDSATTGGTPTGIYVGTRSGPVLFYDGDPTVWARTACEAAGRNLTREEWTTYLGSLGPYAATCSQYPAAP